jgi:hypothetical protein
MISTLGVLSLLAAHFIGDFLLQSDWMALNKSKDNWALFCHCTLYSLVFAPFGLAFMVANFWLHFITDYITSRITSKLWFMNMNYAERILPMSNDYSSVFDNVVFTPWKRHWFFVAIGADQLVHFVTLVLTYKLLAGV